MTTDKRWRVLIGSKTFGQAFPEHLKMLEDAGCEIIPNGIAGRPYREAELLDVLKGVDAIVTGTDELTARVINSADQLKTIAKHGVGLDAIDLAAAKAKGVSVSSTPGANHDSVADLTMGLLLALARSIIPVHNITQQGGWDSPFGIELRDKLMGIVGLGRVGKGVAIRAKSFGMQVAAYDPYPDHAFAAENNITLMKLDDLLQTADVVTLHAAAEQIKGTLIDADRIRLMKPTAFFINTARGSLVDEAALATALREKRLAGAGLDAFVDEPLPTDSPFLALDNVVLTSHIAGRTIEAAQRMGEIVVENCLRGLRGETPLYPVV